MIEIYLFWGGINLLIGPWWGINAGGLVPEDNKSPLLGLHGICWNYCHIYAWEMGVGRGLEKMHTERLRSLRRDYRSRPAN